MRAFLENHDRLNEEQQSEALKQVSELKEKDIPVSGIITLVVMGLKLVGRIIHFGNRRKFVIEKEEKRETAANIGRKALEKIGEKATQAAPVVKKAKKVARKAARVAKKATKAPKAAPRK